MAKITPSDAMKALNEKCLKPGDLERFPFGDLLLKIWNYQEKGKESFTYREHIQKVVDVMKILLGKEPEKIFPEWDDPQIRRKFLDTRNKLDDFFHFDECDTQMLFLLSALYHDIGKYIIKERHPIIGWYTMEYFPDPDEKSALCSLVGGREDHLQMILSLVRDHDQFGVLSTGEASFPVLLDATTSMGNSIVDHKRIISAIMWFNLADMTATLGTGKNGVKDQDIQKFIIDWQWYMDALDRWDPQKDRLDNYIIQSSCNDDLVVQRISRLLLESCRNSKARRMNLSRFDTQTQATRAQVMVRKQLGTVYGTRIPRSDFSWQFTHICKLDYGKRFFLALVEYCDGPCDNNDNKTLPFHHPTCVDDERLIYAVLGVLRKINSTYLSMVLTSHGPGNLIGVEMKDLCPENAPEKTAEICRLLIDNHYAGQSWMMSDCPAWYF